MANWWSTTGQPFGASDFIAKTASQSIPDSLSLSILERATETVRSYSTERTAPISIILRDETIFDGQT